MKAFLTWLAVALVAVLAWQWWDWPAPKTQSRIEKAGPVRVEIPSGQKENPLDLLSPLGEKQEYALVT